MPDVQQINALVANGGNAVDKQPSPMGPQYNDYQRKMELCRLLGLNPEQLEYLAAMCDAGAKHGTNWMGECLSTVRRCETTCDTVKRLCLDHRKIIQMTCCPGNKPYSQITLDEYSDDNQVRLNQIVQNFGAGFVNALPVPPASSIRLEHLSRPGYVPTKIAVDISFANNGNNYLDLQIQFYLGEGGTTKGKAIGPLYSGNQFLNKDGTQIHIEFPQYKTLPVDVGFFEKLAVEINNSGGVNNILSISVVVYHEAKCWAELCATPSELC